MAHPGPFPGGHKWNWNQLSLNPAVTPEFIMAHPGPFPDGHVWNWPCLSYNPSITLDFIQANIDHPWNWNILSSNKFEKSPFIVERTKKREEAQRIAIGKKLVPFQRKWIDWYYNPKNPNMIKRLDRSFNEFEEEMATRGVQSI